MGEYKFRLTIQAGLCLIGCLQLVAFTSLLFQFPYLYGRHGLQPISTVLEGAQADAAQQQLKLAGTTTLPFPSLLWLHGSLGLTAEAMLAALCSIGWLLSAAAACGVAHPLLFTALWVVYLSFKSLGGDFLEYGDEVLLEVSFAAIWLAVGHRTNQYTQQQQDPQDPQHSRLSQLTSLKDPKQQQQQTTQHINTATLLLCKWLLFRLLLVTSTFSATYLCGQNPVLHSCWKTIAAHGLPHALTRWLQGFPGPVAAAAAAVTLLELPVAFLVLACMPALQRLTAMALLGLQLLRLVAGPASLANLSAAVLCFLLFDDGLWVPALLRTARALGLRAEVSTDGVQESGHAQAGGTEPLSRTSSWTSLVGEMFQQPEELGESVIDVYGSALMVGAAVLVPCAALLLSYDSRLGLLLRPTAAQLVRVLRVAVPVAMAAWAATAALACWRSVSAALAAGRASAAQALADAEQAAAAAETAGKDAAKALREAEAAAQLAADAAPTPQPEANGEGDKMDPVDSPGRYLHHLQLHPPLPAPVAAALLGPVANGVHEAAAEDAGTDGQDTDGDGEGAPSKAAGRKGRTTKAAAGKTAAAAKGSKAGTNAAKEAAAESPKAVSAGKGRTPGQQFAAMQAEEAVGSPVAAASPKRGAGGRSAAKTASAAAAAAAAAAQRAEAARKEAAACQREAAVAEAAQKQHLRHALVGAWVPAAAAAAVAVAVLAVFVSGAPQLLTAVNHSPAVVRTFFPGPVPQLALLGQSLGLASGSSSARAVFIATQQAAAAAGPGAVLLYEAYVSDSTADSSDPGQQSKGAAASAWQKVPLQYSLGSGQLKGRQGLGQGVKGLRGWCQMRLQAQMVPAAAAGANQSGDGTELWPWLLVLAHKIVQGAPELAGLLDQPVQQHDFVTISRAAYVSGVRDWRLDAAHTTPAVEPQHKSSPALTSWAEAYTATAGNDGLLVSLLESLTRQLSGPWVLTALLLAVVARHLLLPGGLLQECQRATPVAAAQH